VSEPYWLNARSPRSPRSPRAGTPGAAGPRGDQGFRDFKAAGARAVEFTSAAAAAAAQRRMADLAGRGKHAAVHAAAAAAIFQPLSASMQRRGTVAGVAPAGMPAPWRNAAGVVATAPALLPQLPGAPSEGGDGGGGSGGAHLPGGSAQLATARSRPYRRRTITGDGSLPFGVVAAPTVAASDGVSGRQNAWVSPSSAVGAPGDTPRWPAPPPRPRRRASDVNPYIRRPAEILDASSFEFSDGEAPPLSPLRAPPRLALAPSALCASSSPTVGGGGAAARPRVFGASPLKGAAAAAPPARPAPMVSPFALVQQLPQGSLGAVLGADGAPLCHLPLFSLGENPHVAPAARR